MRLLDLFCGAGGCAVGYHQAGFTNITGVDIVSMPRYPFRFIQADALEYLARHGQEFDVIHASPPCQAYSVTAPLSSGNHPALVGQIRLALYETGRPYIIENVPGAPLMNPLMLCGTMFGLGVLRHRLFECNPEIWFPPASCAHDGRTTGNRCARAGITRTPSAEKDGYRFITVAGNNYLADEGRRAMGIDWMTKKELSQAIPPAYTKWIGKCLIKALKYE